MKKQKAERFVLKEVANSLKHCQNLQRIITKKKLMKIKISYLRNEKNQMFYTRKKQQIGSTGCNLFGHPDSKEG